MCRRDHYIGNRQTFKYSGITHIGFICWGKLPRDGEWTKIYLLGGSKFYLPLSISGVCNSKPLLRDGSGQMKPKPACLTQILHKFYFWFFQGQFSTGQDEITWVRGIWCLLTIFILRWCNDYCTHENFSPAQTPRVSQFQCIKKLIKKIEYSDYF